MTATVPAPRETVEGAPRKERDPFLDNAKCVAILLVVVGHSIGPVLDHPVARTAYLFLYAFHMPLFVFLCGHLSRSYEGRPRQAGAVVTGILVPFLLFQIPYVLQEEWLAGEPLELQYVDPVYVLWFLVSLAIWRLSAPVLRAVRLPVLVAVAVSLTAGLSDALGETLSLGRTAGLLPFFVLGLVVRREHLALLGHRAARAVAVPVLAGGVAAVAVWRDSIDREWIYWRAGYGEIGLTWPEGMAVRAGAMLAGLLLAAAVLALTPRRRCVLTTLGAGTMTAFLLHGLVLRIPAIAEWFRDPATLGDVATCAAGGLVMALVLLSPPVRKVFSPFTEPPAGLLLRPQRAAAPGTREEPPTRREGASASSGSGAADAKVS